MMNDNSETADTAALTGRPCDYGVLQQGKAIVFCGKTGFWWQLKEYMPVFSLNPQIVKAPRLAWGAIDVPLREVDTTAVRANNRSIFATRHKWYG